MSESHHILHSRTLEEVQTCVLTPKSGLCGLPKSPHLSGVHFPSVTSAHIYATRKRYVSSASESCRFSTFTSPLSPNCVLTVCFCPHLPGTSHSLQHSVVINFPIHVIFGKVASKAVCLQTNHTRIKERS